MSAVVVIIVTVILDLQLPVSSRLKRGFSGTEEVGIRKEAQSQYAARIAVDVRIHTVGGELLQRVPVELGGVVARRDDIGGMVRRRSRTHGGLAGTRIDVVLGWRQRDVLAVGLV